MKHKKWADVAWGVHISPFFMFENSYYLCLAKNEILYKVDYIKFMIHYNHVSKTVNDVVFRLFISIYDKTYFIYIFYFSIYFC